MAILSDFARRTKITYPLLADPQSEVIRAFGILNTAIPDTERSYGVPYPGTFIVDANGIVRSKYFEDKYQERYSAPTILLTEFGSAAGTRETLVSTDHLDLKYYSTKDPIRPNLRFTLAADFDLKPKMHVYAPGVKGYIPIRLSLNTSPNYTAQPVDYPKSEMLRLPAINETVAVYQGKFRLTQDITMEGNDPLRPILDGSREVKIKGSLRYQACDDKICYLPQTLPLEWVLKLEPLDSQRVPEAIQHKAPADRK